MQENTTHSQPARAELVGRRLPSRGRPTTAERQATLYLARQPSTANESEDLSDNLAGTAAHFGKNRVRLIRFLNRKIEQAADGFPSVRKIIFLSDLSQILDLFLV